MKKITILGLGYIGLPTAITLADAGFPVYGFDVSSSVIDTLKSGKIHIVEPGLQEAFTRAVKAGNLTFGTEMLPADVFYIAVPTPFYKNNDGKHKADLKYVMSAGEMIAKVITDDNLVILESTVPPGTTNLLAETICQNCDISKESLLVAHCPERVIPGKMLEELKNNDRIIGAKNPKAADIAADIYKTVLEKGKCLITDDITAEMCKLTENTFRDVNIAFANELSIICDKMNIDVFELIKLANCHPRVNVLTPGVGVGGHCIAVDPWFIYEQFPAEAKVILASRTRNEQKPRFVANKVLSLTDKTATIGVLGLSYKPNVDDLRESPSIELCHILQDKGMNVLACEPFSNDSIIDGITNISFDEILTKADFFISTLGHTLFIENKDIIKARPYYDCVGILND